MSLREIPSDSSAAIPPIAWGHAESATHAVQFHEDDAALLESLVRFAGAALLAGDAVLMLATAEHRDGLAARLRERGLDIDGAANQGRFMALDAGMLLSQVMRVQDGSPDAATFLQVMGGLIDQASAAVGERRQVAVFGELVALACAEGNLQAAVQLEQLWNDLAQTRAFTLLCGYPMNTFGQTADGTAFADICDAHQHIVPAESFAALTDEADRLLIIAQLQQKARALETEIAEREKAQRLLQRREAELADFVEEAPVAMHWVGPDGAILWANRAELDLLGLARDEYVGRHLAEFHVDHVAAAEILAQLARQESLVDHPASLQHQDGSVRHVLISSNVYVEDGQFRHTRCVTRDVTDRPRADEASARLAAIVDSSDDAIVSKTLDGTITSWNHGAEHLFGYLAEDIIGRSITTIVPPERHADHAKVMARLARGERIAHLETERVRKDGTRVEVSVTISPIHDSTGRVVGASKIARDITDRRTLERQKQEFLEMVAHDLGSPLTVIQGYGQLLQRRQNYDARAVAAIVEKTSQMGRLVADMLDMTRLEAGRLDLRRSEVDLTALVRNCAAQGALIAGDDRPRIEAPEWPILGEWDEDRLAQVLTNLIDNALKYAPHGDIMVRVTDLPHEAQVAVIDQGPGLTQNELRHVFDHYFRSSRTAGQAKGAGLGLFISKAIVDAHGGRLWADSAPGQGSTFAFSLPYG